jgi:hypothetical protein
MATYPTGAGNTFIPKETGYGIGFTRHACPACGLAPGQWRFDPEGKSTCLECGAVDTTPKETVSKYVQYVRIAPSDQPTPGLAYRRTPCPSCNLLVEWQIDERYLATCSHCGWKEESPEVRQAILKERERILNRVNEIAAAWRHDTRISSDAIVALEMLRSCITHAGVSKEEAIAAALAKREEVRPDVEVKPPC